MSLTRLDNLYSSKSGKYLYVSPDDFNATDTLDNRGNSPNRPFKTIQRAFLEVARFSYQPGANNDRFDQFSIMLMPGDHYIDNRPGLVNYSIGGSNNSRNRFFDAGNLLNLNKEFIAYEAYARMIDDPANAGFIPQDSSGNNLTPQDCIDDVLDVLDEIIYNVKFGENSRVFDAALIYQNDTGLLAGETEEAKQVYQFAAQISREVITQATISTITHADYLSELGLSQPYPQVFDPSISTGPSEYNDGGAIVPYGQVNTCADVQSQITTLFQIIEDGIDGALNPADRTEPQSFGELPVFNFDQATGEWDDNSIIDLSNPDNIYWKFNASTGGAIVPRGCSLVGYDLRRTIVRPLYVPDPADSNQERTSIFNLTGGCYIWQFTIKDGDLSPNSPLYNSRDNVGKVYYQKGNVTSLAIPDYSHHKITIMEYATKGDLDAYYEKVGKAFEKYQPTIVDEGEFDALVQENRIVGPLSDTRSIDNIKAIDANLGQPNQKLILQVTTKIDHGYFKDQFVAILNTGLDEETNGTFKIASIDSNNPKVFTYEIPGKVAAGLGLTNNAIYQVGSGLSPNAISQAEIDSVESASPYVFNCSIRSTWGMCGMWADGSKASGFKSMVVAQYTGVSLQKDDRAFIRYDEFTNTWNQASLTDAFATVPYHTKGDAYWKDDWRNFHIRASEDAFIQCVSVFAVGFFDHFLMESGGDMSITNSNSNFGNTSLHAIGFKGFAFNQDKGGYITDIIPPKLVEGGYALNPNDDSTNSIPTPYYPVDITSSNDLNNETKLFLGADDVYDPETRPAATLNGYRIGARPDEKLFVELEERTDGDGTKFTATLTPTGIEQFVVGISFLNPTGIAIDNEAQDASNLINSNKEFIQDEAYGYITNKYPALLTNEDITIATCRRDIGYYVDAIVQDLRLGGNINSVQAAEAYFVGGQLTYIQNESDETIDTLGYVKDLCLAAMRNFDYVVSGATCASGTDVITMPAGIGTAGLVVGMRVESYDNLDPSNNTEALNRNGIIPDDAYITRIDGNNIFIGDKGEWTFGGFSSVPNPSGTNPTTQSASGNLILKFTLRDETVATGQDGIVAVRDGIFSTVRTQYDDTIIQDIVNPGETECYEVASVITGLFDDIKTILESPFGQDGVERVEPTTDFSALSKRATLFRVSTGNPHKMETGTPVRLIPKPAPGKNPDPRVIRLPKGFETNTKYYIIAPGRKTSPEDYSSTTAFDSSDQTVFMLATTLENARAGNYIYSPETDSIDPDVIIEVNKFIVDTKYDLYQYVGSLDAGAGVITTDVSHSFDVPGAGITEEEAQKVFFRPINVGAQLPFKNINVGGVPQQILVEPTESFYTRFVNNNVFAIYNTLPDAQNDINRVVLSGTDDFKIFSNKRFSPLRFDPNPISYGRTVVETGQWYLQVKSYNDVGEDPETSIIKRITEPQDNTYSGSAPSVTRSPDSYFERVIDDREKEDRIYKLRYVIPQYLETVRDPLNGFVIKVRTDEQRRLRPQKILLKPLVNAPTTDEGYNSGSVAVFKNPAASNENLGRSKAVYDGENVTPTYDAYRNPKIVESDRTDSKIAFSIQSARVATVSELVGGQAIDAKYLELTVFNHTITNTGIKNEQLVVVKTSAVQVGNFVADSGSSTSANEIQWTGASSGTGYLHAVIETNPGQKPYSSSNETYLIIKGVTGSIEYSQFTNTRFQQGAVFADLLAKPDSVGDPEGKSKSSRDDYLYSIKGAAAYTMVPGDVIRDDEGTFFYIDSVEDIGDLEESFYIFDIQEIQERIPGQQDGVYYLICLKGDVRPFPTGPGVGQNFRNFKFSQPISYLYPANYVNDPLWYQSTYSLASNAFTTDATILDPPQAFSAADNYTHGLVTINDSRASETKETIDFITESPILSEYTYENDVQSDIDARIQAQRGNAASGSENRKIPIKGTSRYPTDSKLYVELRRPSIARSGNHTFEYLGFGPGNYSTGFPLRQEVILTDAQDFYAQSKREDGGIVFYTGLNSNGDLYIGNKKVNAITGEETFLESAALIGFGDENDLIGTALVTTFESPVTFNNKITVNGTADFRQPVTINVDPEDAILPIASLTITSNGQIELGDDPTLDRDSFTNRAQGDIKLSKNRINSAIFAWNPRGNRTFTGQSYSIRTHYAYEPDENGDFTVLRPSNVTPEQSTQVYSGINSNSNRLFNNQQVYFGPTQTGNVPVPGDIVLKGKEVGFSGSWGWIYANTFSVVSNLLVQTYVTLKRNPLGELEEVVGQPPANYEATPYLRLKWAEVGGSTITNQDLFQSNGLTSESLVRIVGIVGDLSTTANGTFVIYEDTYSENQTFIDIVLNSNISAFNIVADWNATQAAAELSFSNSTWKEMGVIGSEVFRTDSDTLGDYKVGINTVSRTNHSDYLTGFITEDTTAPQATLDLVGNVFISGTTDSYFDPILSKNLSEYKREPNASLRTKYEVDNALNVGGDAFGQQNYATLRVSTTNNGRVGINLTNRQLNGNADFSIYNKAFAVLGDSTFSGSIRVEQNLEVNGAVTAAFNNSVRTIGVFTYLGNNNGSLTPTDNTQVYTLTDTGTQATGTGAQVNVTITNGTITSVSVVEQSGSGYTSGDTLTFDTSVFAGDGNIETSVTSLTGDYTTAVLSSRARTFNFIDTATNDRVRTLNMGGQVTRADIFDDTTDSQLINIGTNAGSATESSTTELNIHTESNNSVVNLGIVSNDIPNTSLITVGGAINTRNASELLIRNYRTTLAGKLIIRGGGSDLGTTGFIEGESVDSMIIFPEEVRTIDFAARANRLFIAATSGTTQIRNNLEVLGSTKVLSDITLEGGLRNSNLGISRNEFGLIDISSLSRTNGVATLTSVAAHGLTTGTSVLIRASDITFATDVPVTITRIDDNTFTYSNGDAGGSDNLTQFAATGTVITPDIGTNQGVGDIETQNFNVDYYKVFAEIAPRREITGIDGNNRLLLDFNYFNVGDPVRFILVGTLSALVNTNDTYYVLTSNPQVGITLVQNPGDTTPITFSSVGTDPGEAIIVLAQTEIDTEGSDPWGGSTYNNGDGTYRLYVNNPTGLTANRYYLIGTEIVFSRTDPSPVEPFYIDVERAKDSTQLVEHADGSDIVQLGRDIQATYIFPQPLDGVITSIGIGEFSAATNPGDLLRLNGKEFVKITTIDPSNAQKFIINDGDFGPLEDENPVKTFEITSTTGNAFLIGDLNIGYDRSANSLLRPDVENENLIFARTGTASSTATGADLAGSGGGNLRVHNSIELSGNQSTSGVERQYMVITNGQRPRFYVETASGDTQLFAGAKLRMWNDEVFTTGGWTKDRDFSALSPTNFDQLKVEIDGGTGNADFGGTLRVRDDVSVGYVDGGTGLFVETFNIESTTGSMTLGDSLTLNGTPFVTNTNPAIFSVLSLGDDEALDGENTKDFVIRQDASIDAFGEDSFFNANGGRKTIFIDVQGNTDAQAIQLRSNLNYAVRPTSDLILKLPPWTDPFGNTYTPQTGDIIRVFDVGGALNFGINLVIRANGDPIQGSTGGTTIGGLSTEYGSGGELVINTPNAALGLIYLGATDGNGTSIPGSNRGWYLTEI